MAFDVRGTKKPGSATTTAPEQGGNAEPSVLQLPDTFESIPLGPVLSDNAFVETPKGHKLFLGWVQTTSRTNYPFDVSGINQRLFEMYGPGTEVARGIHKSIEQDTAMATRLTDGHVLIISVVDLDQQSATWQAVRRKENDFEALAPDGNCSTLKAIEYGNIEVSAYAGSIVGARLTGEIAPVIAELFAFLISDTVVVSYKVRG